jgi:CubicO group peptidase (beta-lactamase class C family)
MLALLAATLLAPNSLDSELLASFKTIRQKYSVPAMSVGVWKSGVSHLAFDGVRKLGGTDPVRETDRWLVGSNAKSMTSVLIGTFIEEGKMRWSDTLAKLLPDVPMKSGYKSVTLEQVMQHVGGIPADSTLDGNQVAAIVKDLKDPTAIRRSYVKNILGRDPIGKPGEKFVYSNAGYALLGYIAERIGKKPFETLLRDRVFKPLKLSSAMISEPGSPGSPGSTGQPYGHFADGESFTPGLLQGPIQHMGAAAGLGVALSTPDMLQYLEWHLRGMKGSTVGTLLPETIQRLHRPLITFPEVPPYASGWLTQKPGGEVSHAHMGSDGSFTCLMSIYPEEDLAVVVFANAGVQDPVVEVLQSALQLIRK